jgi:hypothetical protein
MDRAREKDRRIRLSVKSVSPAQLAEPEPSGSWAFSADQVATATQITTFLKGARGGLKAVLGAMRFSKDPVVGRFLAKHDCLAVWERQNTSWEAIALAAGVDWPYLLGAALLARQDDATTRTKVIAICNAPELMKKRVEYAKLPGGWRDRDFIHMFVGSL